jgi:hypothetical protein
LKVEYSVCSGRILSGFDRSAADQATESLSQALRVLDLVPQEPTNLTPHPLVVVRVEIENARRYLSLAAAVAAGGSPLVEHRSARIQ